jgi:hypothetical protein
MRYQVFHAAVDPDLDVLLAGAWSGRRDRESRGTGNLRR